MAKQTRKQPARRAKPKAKTQAKPAAKPAQPDAKQQAAPQAGQQANSQENPQANQQVKPQAGQQAKPQPRGFSPEVWFHTPVWSREVVEHQRINSEILAILDKLEKDTPSISRSNVGGWHSPDNLHHREDMAEIRRIIGRTCVGCATFMEFDFDNFELIITEMWLNKNGPGDFNRAHIHPNAILSGAYYVSAPEGSGNIEFYDPVPARLMTTYPIKTNKPINAQAAEYAARDGLLLIFPSWLQHAVQPNRSDKPRVSMSFNVSFRRSSRQTAQQASG